MPNITTNHAITYTKTYFDLFFFPVPNKNLEPSSGQQSKDQV